MSVDRPQNKRESGRHDSWKSGDLYEAYIGCWSYQIAGLFLKILGAEPDLHWIDIGSGTGALSRAIAEYCDPADLIGLEPSAQVRAWAQRKVTDERVSFIDGDACDLPLDDNSVDVAVSGLVLNFLPRPMSALREMKRVVRPGGRVAFYVWDYAHGGLEIVRVFWDVAVSIRADAHKFSDAVRFKWCNAVELRAMMVEAGLSDVRVERIVIPTVFENFDDYWHRFSRGAGPTSTYYQQLDPIAQDKIKTLLSDRLCYQDDGSIRLNAAVWAVYGLA